jgi:hypothetical protein
VPGRQLSTGSRPNATTVFGGEWAAVLLRRGVSQGESGTSERVAGYVSLNGRREAVGKGG